MLGSDDALLLLLWTGDSQAVVLGSCSLLLVLLILIPVCAYFGFLLTSATCEVITCSLFPRALVFIAVLLRLSLPCFLDILCTITLLFSTHCPLFVSCIHFTCYLFLSFTLRSCGVVHHRQTDSSSHTHTYRYKSPVDDSHTQSTT